MLKTIRLTVSSPEKAFTHTVLGNNTIKIGRSLRCEFCIPLEDLSREHCLIEIDDSHFYITDLGSSNGVWIDKERIPPDTKVKIFPESTIVLSNLYLMMLSQLEIKEKSEINQEMSEPKTKITAQGIEPLALQLEFPEKKEIYTSTFIKTRAKKPVIQTKSKHGQDEKIMIIAFLLAAGFIIYNFFFR